MSLQRKHALVALAAVSVVILALAFSSAGPLSAQSGDSLRIAQLERQHDQLLVATADISSQLGALIASRTDTVKWKYHVQDFGALIDGGKIATTRITTPLEDPDRDQWDLVTMGFDPASGRHFAVLRQPK